MVEVFCSWKCYTILDWLIDWLLDTDNLIWHQLNDNIEGSVLHCMLISCSDFSHGIEKKCLDKVTCDIFLIFLFSF